MMIEPSRAVIEDAVHGLDRWFDSMRVTWPTSGYGGPVVHWWGHSLAFQGTGLDWRYEGIVAGYLTLYRSTGETYWLDKAVQAGWDLVDGQLPDGNFQNSGFERNPEIGGTPHEAADDVALLLLAKDLRESQPILSQRFSDAARLNLHEYWLEKLWHGPSMTLWDRPDVPSFVPNKAATFVDALLLLCEVTGDDRLVERYAVPTADSILDMQLTRPGNLLDGGIAQNWYRDQMVHAYYPLYIARCIPPLLKLTEFTGDLRYRQSAAAATRFLLRVRDPDGGFPQVLYRDGRRNRYPRWVAGAGDIVRALLAAMNVVDDADVTPTVGWILHGVRGDGRIVAAEGFGRVIPGLSRKDHSLDEIGVVGWCDKAFRALAQLSSSGQSVQRTHQSTLHHAGIAPYAR
jgi:hypothetical protein